MAGSGHMHNMRHGSNCQLKECAEVYLYSVLKLPEYEYVQAWGALFQPQFASYVPECNATYVARRRKEALKNPDSHGALRRYNIDATITKLWSKD